MSKYAVCVLCVVACLVGLSTSAQVVPVTVYYESLCPDSIKFYTSQLFPAYTSPLKKYFSLKLVPFGKATYKKLDDTTYEFNCHHGPNECYGNKVQGCALRHLPEERDQVTLINCLMGQALGNKNGTYPVEKCGATTKLDVATIVTCANGTEGSEILIDHGSETQKLIPSLTSVPTVVFNGNFNQKDQTDAQSDFKAALCSYLQEEHVHECHSHSSASFASFLFFLPFLPIFSPWV